jgi:hypothetical protein
MDIRKIQFWIFLGLLVCVFEKVLTNVSIVLLLIIAFYLLVVIIKQIKDID